MGRVIHGNAQDSGWQDVFVRNAIELLTDPNLEKKQQYVKETARRRFSVEHILNQWQDKVFKHG
jgi:hypothetical protein